ncbi:MAG: putative short-chain dehydrogenase [Firmicutes bacterium]|nr:putative short-chain dehydrogenase [Bacillota bacterium]
MDLRGKVAVVTGASKGIGASIAIELARLGANVVINYNSDKEGAADVLSAVRDAGGIGSVACADVSKYGDAAGLIASAVETYGRIDILVNNAGVSKTGLFIDMTEEDFDDLMGVNLKGVYNCSHSALKYMLPQKSGSIVNISSIWGEAGASCEVIYSAAKGGVNSFTKALSKELAPNGIRVNAVSPGVIDTRMNSFLSEDEREVLECEIPMGYFGKCIQVAKVVAFLCLDASSYVTGQVIKVDGGFV